jgi:4-hydroxybenzoate polyprenyltransferase
MRLKDRMLTYLRLSRVHAAASESLLVLIAALLMGQKDTNLLIILFVIGILYHVYLFVLNEYADIEVDKLSKDLTKKPLVSGDISPRSALGVVISAAIATFFLTIIFFPSLAAVLFLTLALIFGALYDFYGKKIIGYSDLLVAASLAFIFLYGAGTVSNQLTNIVYIIAGTIFVAIVFANAIEGGLKDVDHDYLGGARTLATIMGVTVKERALQITKRFRFFGYSLIGICFVLLLFLGYQDEVNLFGADYVKLTIIAVMIVVMLATSYKLLNLKIFDRTKIKRLYAILNSAGGVTLLIILVPLIGIEVTLILLVVPISWYVAFNIVLYGKPLQPVV